MDKQRYSFMLSKSLIDEFNDYCFNHAFNPSAKVELLLRKEMFMAKRKTEKYQEMYNILKAMADKKVSTEIAKPLKEVRTNPKPKTGKVPTIWELAERRTNKFT